MKISFYMGNSQQHKYTRKFKNIKQAIDSIKELAGVPETNTAVFIENESGLPEWMDSLKIQGYSSIVLLHPED